MDKFFMISNAETDSMRAVWEYSAELFLTSKRPLIRIYKDTFVVGGWGMPMKGDNILIEADDGGGWGQVHIDHFLSQDEFLNRKSKKTIAIDDDVNVALLSSPGAYTYGHWITDICPRIEVLSNFFELKELRYIVPQPLPNWTEQFLDVYNITLDQLIITGNENPVFVKKLIVPNHLRTTDYLPDYPHLDTINRIRSVSSQKINKEKYTGKRLLVKHVPMGSQGHRSLMCNFSAVEALLLKYGFETISPAEMSRDDQISAFANAEIIVGEDSSALHNIIYSNSINLIVLGAKNRPNYLHFSLAALMGHGITYISRNDSSPGWFECPLDELESVVQSALHGL